jgi:hypothetical protein
VATGDTLYLRGGTYRENVAVRIAGRRESPITIRSFPGETAVIDGGLAEFFETPVAAWEPHPAGAPGEYRSTRTYPNLRGVVASFGDSMIGLNTYYHVKDLRATSELVEPEPDKSDIKPLWCGPGLWYDRATGRIHARLGHTKTSGLENYRGETDPRRVPLVIAPFRALPLHVDRAEHVRFHDLVIRGGGYDTVRLDQANDIEFDNVTVWAGTYGVRATGVQRLRVHGCGVYGNAPPWATRFEAGFNTYPGRTERDITRYNTHALLVADANKEFEVYCYPFNDDWEIGHSEFCDAGSDGLYLGGVNLRFHHNLVTNTRDDGLYLSPMYPRHAYLRGGATLHIYQNYFSRCLTMLAFGGAEATRDTIYFCRNIVDLREPVPTGRATPQRPTAAVDSGKVTGDHGSPPWPSMFSYHNTFIMRSQARAADAWLSSGATADRPRRVFNNILVHLTALPPHQLNDSPHLEADGNLYWQPDVAADRAASFFKKYRDSAAFENSKKVYAPGFDATAIVADPKFVRSEAEGPNDYRLQPSSPAIDTGVDLPADWPDPLRERSGKPDIGALPSGAEMLRVGRGVSR